MIFRADYWKSNAKKYCDFCKCWITDNKPSVEFHEKGRRHQENVARRLKQISRNNVRLETEGFKLDAAMAKMEAAALEAYKKDVANNADLTSQAINEKLVSENLAIAGGSGEKLWREARSETGRTYYWNSNTNDTVWEPPKEGFISLSQAKELDDLIQAKARKQYMKKVLLNSKLQEQEESKQRNEERARKEREKLRERCVKEDSPPQHAPIIEEGPTNPYGRWQTVPVKESVVAPELPRAVHHAEEGTSAEAHEEAPEVKFKEKAVVCLDIFGDTQFKKRKSKGQHPRQLRPRTEDDY